MDDIVRKYDKYIRLFPANTTIEREIDGTKYTFAVEAYEDVDTGEIYYKASSIKKMEDMIKEMNQRVKDTRKAILDKVAREMRERVK